MGQKVHPTGIRLGISTEWTSRWYAEGRGYADFLQSDLEIREYLKKKLKQASVSRIQIDRPAKAAFITIHTARPGIVIGKKGEDIEALRKEVARRTGLSVNNVKINIEEIRKPEIDSQLVAESIAQQLERRIMFRRAMKRAVSNAMRLGALGVKINVGGRLNGAEIARSEWYREGRVPLHTLRANIDYGFAEALTTYGIIGIKTWIYKGDVYDLNDKENDDVTEKPKSAANKSKQKTN
jgi:small subunit ribosomal protein S3